VVVLAVMALPWVLPFRRPQRGGVAFTGVWR
jgi:hypothetical protein